MRQTLTRCRAYGLVVSSRWPILGGMAIASHESAHRQLPDIVVIESPDDGPESRTHQPRHHHSFSYAQRTIGRFQFQHPNRVLITRFEGSQDIEFLRALISTTLPAALWLRDELVLHAAAAVLKPGGQAIAISGPSGSGKSTILEQLVSRQACVIGEDTLCARVIDEEIRISGLPGVILLPSNSASDAERRCLRPVPPEQQLPAATLGAIMILDMPRGNKTSGFYRLKETAALAALLNSRHRSWIPRLLGREGDMLQNVMRVLKRVEIYSWVRVAGAPSLADDEVSFLQCRSNRCKT